MSRYIRSELFDDGSVVDPLAIDRDLRRAAEAFNGTVGSIQMEDAIVNSSKLVDAATCDYYVENDPFSTPLTFERQDIVSRNWTVIPESAPFEWTANDDGVCMGSLEFSVRCFTQTVRNPVYGWAIAVYMDGTLIGRSDTITLQYMSGSVPFHAVCAKGSHTFTVAVKAFAYSASTAPDPEDVIQLIYAALWWEQKKR